MLLGEDGAGQLQLDSSIVSNPNGEDGGVCAQFVGDLPKLCVCEDEPIGAKMICTVDTPITDPAVFTLDYNVCNSKHISVTIDLSVPGLGSFEDTVTAGTDDDSGSLNTGISVAGQGFYVDYTLTGETASAGLDVELVLKTTFGNTDLVGFSLPTADYTASCALNQDGYYCYDNYCVKEKYLMGAGGVAALSLLACILCVCMGRKQKNKTPKPSDMGYAPMDDKAQQYGQQQQQQQYV